MMTTQTEFYLANQVDGNLTDAQTMQMLDLPEGDSTPQVQDGVPDTEAAVATPSAEVEVKPVETEQPPVILAKDGVHTIPFEKLTEAREAERSARAIAADLQQQLDALRNATPAQVAKSLPAAELDADVFGDYSEEAIARGVEMLVDRKTAAIEAKLAAVLAPIQEKEQNYAIEDHFSAIEAKHPDVESLVPSQEFGNWLQSQPSVARVALIAAIESGTAQQVIEVLDAYRATTTVRPAATPTKPSAVAAAQAAIAKAQSAPPLSLSEIPAGTNAAHDETAAMMEMSSIGLMSKFEGKSPEQIMALMSKVL
jgi:hypothetical protein